MHWGRKSGQLHRFDEARQAMRLLLAANPSTATALDAHATALEAVYLHAAALDGVDGSELLQQGLDEGRAAVDGAPQHVRLMLSHGRLLQLAAYRWVF